MVKTWVFLCEVWYRVDSPGKISIMGRVWNNYSKPGGLSQDCLFRFLSASFVFGDKDALFLLLQGGQSSREGFVTYFRRERRDIRVTFLLPPFFTNSFSWNSPCAKLPCFGVACPEPISTVLEQSGGREKPTMGKGSSSPAQIYRSSTVLWPHRTLWDDGKICVFSLHDAS